MRRFPKFSIANRMALLAVIVTTSLLAMMGVAAFGERALAQDERKRVTEAAVDSAISTIAHYAAQAEAGELTRTEAQAAAMSTISTLRYLDDEYVWIHDLDLNMVMHPTQPNLDGTDISDNADPNGVLLFVEMNKTIAADGEGFVAYSWPKPGQTEPQPKISYVNDFQPWGWVVGSGVYVDDIEADFRATVATLLAWGIPIIAVALLLTLTTAATINRRVASLRRSADEELPAALSSIETAVKEGGEVPELKPLKYRTEDELTELSTSFNNVVTTAMNLAKDQAQLRKSTAEMYVNLGRRNHKLLSRTLSYISELEKSERDPDNLRQLFLLDHLVTRMRRHAESLLVLAGSAPVRTWKRPVAVENVMRAALSEVEDYDRVDVGPVQPVGITGGVVSDLSHLLAELLENGIAYSPPETRVRLIGRASRHNYTITVIDEGIGMSAEEIVEANERIVAAAEATELDTSKMLGLAVVGRLSARHGLVVKLSASPMGGIAVAVTVPPTLCTDLPDSDDADDSARQTDRDDTRQSRENGASAPSAVPPGPAQVQLPASPAEPQVPTQHRAAPAGTPDGATAPAAPNAAGQQPNGGGQGTVKGVAQPAGAPNTAAGRAGTNAAPNGTPRQGPPNGSPRQGPPNATPRQGPPTGAPRQGPPNGAPRQGPPNGTPPQGSPNGAPARGSSPGTAAPQPARQGSAPAGQVARPRNPAAPGAATAQGAAHGRHNRKVGQPAASGKDSRTDRGLTRRVRGAQLPDTGPDTVDSTNDAPARTAGSVRSALASFRAGQTNAQRGPSRNQPKGQQN